MHHQSSGINMNMSSSWTLFDAANYAIYLKVLTTHSPMPLTLHSDLILRTLPKKNTAEHVALHARAIALAASSQIRFPANVAVSTELTNKGKGEDGLAAS